MRTARIPTRYRDPLAGRGWRDSLARRVLGVGQPTEEEISRFRDTLHDSDPLADAVVRAFADLPPGEGHRMLREALRAGVAGDAPEALKALFAEVGQRPAWVDDAELRLAADVVDRVGLSGQRVLSCISLTGGYRSSAANKPIAFTGALKASAARRLAETSKFVVDLYDSRTVPRDSEGFHGAVMVRVMHAVVRDRLASDPRWQPDDWGLPVNQADMLATNLLFSAVFVLGLRALGHVITRREADAIVHFWRYVGVLMGIREALLPRDFGEACQLVLLAEATQPGADQDSRDLAASLLAVPVPPDLSPLRQRLDVSWRAGFSRLTLGKRNADSLGLPDDPLKWLVALSVARNASIEAVRLTVPGAHRLIVRVRRERVRRVVAKALEGVAPTYRPSVA